MNQYNLLQSEDIKDAVNLGTRMVSCRDFSMFKEGILEDLTYFLSAETSAFMTFSDQDTITNDFSCSHGISQKRHQEYINGFFKNDPAMDILSRNISAKQNSNEVMLLEQHIDYYKYTSGFFYNSFLRPLNIHHLMLINIRVGLEKNNSILIGMHRPKTKDSFSQQDIQKARMIIPTVAGTINNLVSQGLLKERQAIINHLAHDMQKTGLLILSGNMDILYASTTFHTHLKNNPQSTAPIPENIAQTCHDIKNKLSEEGCNMQLLHKELHSEDHNIIFNITLSKTESPSDGLRFIIYSAETSTLPINEEHMQHYLLTHREKDVACQVTLGLTNIQIAGKLGISMRTVENHLRAIYAKTKVRNRTSLIHTLSQPYL